MSVTKLILWGGRQKLQPISTGWRQGSILFVIFEGNSIDYNVPLFRSGEEEIYIIKNAVSKYKAGQHVTGVL